MMDMNRKSGNSVIYGVAIVVLVAAHIFCFSMVSSINRRMNESAVSNLLNTTRVIADTLDGLIRKDYDALRMVGALYERGMISETEQLIALRDTIGFDWIGIVDETGSGSDYDNNRFGISEYPETESWNLRETGHSDAYVGRMSGRSQITIWTPIYREDTYIGTVLGNVILARYYSSNIFTFYEGKGRTYLFNASNGSWIIRSMGSDGTLSRSADIYSLLEASGNTPEDIVAFRETVQAGRQGSAVLDFNGETSCLCFMPMPQSEDWYVATVIARDALLREASEVRIMIGLVLIILCVTLVLFAAAFMLWRVRRARIEEAHYREALFSNVSANIDSAFVIYEKESRKTAFVSDNITRLLGLDRAHIEESADRLFDWCKIPEEDSQRVAFLEGTLEKPAVREVRVENELGQESARTIRLELIPADLGQELAVLSDITSDKEIQSSLIETMERAEAASNAKNDFLSAMSHDLRTPINGIVGMTAIAATHLDDKKRVLDCLKKISESTEQLLNLVNEVLDMSQIESGKIRLTSERFNLAELLQNVLTVNYPGIQQKNHTVNVHIHLMQHEEVIGDPARLTRIAANLISNAIKYTPAGGEINLSLREKDAMLQGYGCYELLVKDNGIGMSPEFLTKLFTPFEREKDVQLSRIQGTGLGLSIVKNLVELMMGSIQVETRKGEGTTFRVTLNLQLDERQAETNSRLAGLKVLVVDDDAAACEPVTDILSSIGMAGEWTNSGEDAIRLIRTQHEKKDDYLAVLLDWKMPKMDGIETARRIRAEVDARVPIIILTAYNWSTIEAEAKEAGIDHFLTKPIYRANLLRKMTEVVEGGCEAFEEVIGLSAKGIPQGRRVLLAEDNELNKEIAIEILRAMGVEADCEENGAAVVRRFAASAPGTYDLILMDIQMPEMNGYEATEAIRNLKRPDGRTVPIVAMTADAFKRDEQMAYEAGMNEHLSKPISVERLAQVLKRFLSYSVNGGREETDE